MGKNQLAKTVRQLDRVSRLPPIQELSQRRAGNADDFVQECIPAKREAMQSYPVEYIRSLESHVADLETKLQQHPVPPDPATFHTLDDSSYQFARSPVNFSFLDTNFSQTLLAPLPPQQNPYQHPHPATNVDNMASSFPSYSNLDPNFMVTFPLQSPINSQDLNRNAISPNALDLHAGLGPAQHAPPPSAADIAISAGDAASYFLAYFDVIHSRYPFLNVPDCSRAYLNWKHRVRIPGDFQTSWYSFLATLIFGIGSRIEQPQNSRARRGQHEMLMSKIQAVQGIISDPQASPLLRLQAMLLYVIFALLGDSTSRLVHFSGVAMRFATLHGFHRLKDSEGEESDQKIRAWSCIYCIDRTVSGTLRIPVCVSELAISSPLYRGKALSLETMPWLADCPEYDSRAELVDLTYFGYMCKLRHIQSKILEGALVVKPAEVPVFIATMEAEIDAWANNEAVSMLIQRGNEGYFSPLYLTRNRSVAEVHLYSTFPLNQDAAITTKLFDACCHTCNVFRAVQKSRQLVRQWVDTVFEFQAGVTLLYLTWRKQSLGNWQEAERAVRNCRSTLVILADGAPVVECFIDCLDAAVTFVTQTFQSAGPEAADDDNNTAENMLELQTSVQKVIDTGIAPHVADMLFHMSQGEPRP